MKWIRTYSELVKLKTFEERFEYLKLGGQVGRDTFGFDRYLNQSLYHSDKWKRDTRNKIILRDEGCDLGIEGLEIRGLLLLHHINPITKNDLLCMSDDIFDPENLICVSFDTHQAIHYGTEPPSIFFQKRRPGDTCPWK